MVHGDDNGLVLPPFVAPSQVVIVPVQMKQPQVIKNCQKIFNTLTKAGYRVKLDDTDATPGFKFAAWEMKGVPLRIELGPRDLAEKKVSVCLRYSGEKRFILIADLKKELPKLFAEIHNGMYEKALNRLNASGITNAESLDKLAEVVNTGGYAKCMWCGDQACEDKVKVETTATARCLPFDQSPFATNCVVCGKEADKVVLFAKAY
jgi:prolyl-tRNA synthetase